jgi:hypothetical protein
MGDGDGGGDRDSDSDGDGDSLDDIELVDWTTTFF